MNNQNEMFSNLLSERSKFIVIGLTGRTGSGCTTAANILESNAPNFPDVDNVTYEDTEYFTGLDKDRYSIVKKYSDNKFQRFYSIKVSDLISACALMLTEPELVDFILSVLKNSSRSKSDIESFIKASSLQDAKSKLKQYQPFVDHIFNNKEITDVKILTKSKFIGFLQRIREFSSKFKKELNAFESNSYVTVFQNAGDSIRRVGKIVAYYDQMDFEVSALYQLPEIINHVIKLFRRVSSDGAYIVVDAIRNPYEAKYFKDRYSAFYLVSINAPSGDREQYLQQVHKYTAQQLRDLDKKESGEFLDDSSDLPKNKCNECGQVEKKSKKYGKYDELLTQNVKKCIEISDLHLFNPRKELDNNNVLKSQLAWYVALMQHPGLITPTSLERVMQIAFTAKINSGCISRQVGAVVTDENYSIKSVGWNDVAKGQVPCNLRSLDGLATGFNPVRYSEFERTDATFRKIASEELISLEPISDSGRNLSYCFKTLKNSADGEKNQVHTRSLHAEENAFLQLAKYGAAAIEGGKLFTTASPCELCAKKAYQLGIKEIVYIDPYPGIAISHIISIGINPPKLTQFRGAVGKGYHQLYEPIMPYKDELSYFKID